LLSLPLEIKMPRKTNIGYSSVPYTAYTVAHGIGIPTSILSSPNLASERIRWTPAFLQVKWSTLWTPLFQQHPCHSALVYTLTILSVFPKTLRLNRNLKPLFPSSSPLNLWGQLNGFLGHTFNGMSQMILSPFTSAKWDSPPILLKTTMSILVT
jgi:hypothetical protein